MSDAVERERLDVDLLFVGRGRRDAGGGDSPRRSVQAAAARDARDPGDREGARARRAPALRRDDGPAGLAELIPDFLEQGFPLPLPVHVGLRLDHDLEARDLGPVTPPPFENHGNYAISVSDVVKWLGHEGRGARHRDLPRLPRAPAAVRGQARGRRADPGQAASTRTATRRASSSPARTSTPSA